MKKYIGLTIYFVGLVLLSYTFFYFSDKSKPIKQIVENTDKSSSVTGDFSGVTSGDIDTTNQDLAYKQSTGVEDLLSGIDEINPTVQTPTGGDENVLNVESNYTGNDIPSTGRVSDIEKEIIPDKLYIGLAEAKLVSGSDYDDIFSLFNLEKYPTYKVTGKNIYLKQLKSVEYNDEKNNIDQLIQQIGGNIVETNLFGDKQLFINPDLYYKKVVIMLVEYDKKVYFLTLPYSKYHDYKAFLKDVLFVNS